MHHLAMLAKIMRRMCILMLIPPEIASFIAHNGPAQPGGRAGNFLIIESGTLAQIVADAGGLPSLAHCVPPIYRGNQSGALQRSILAGGGCFPAPQ